jgi:hypothetical protein
MSEGFISEGRVRDVFSAMLKELSDHPRIRVKEAKLGKPAHPKLIEGVRAVNGGSLPADLEAFYRQMNGFKLRWYTTDLDLLRRFHDDHSISEPEDYDAPGSSEILPIEEALRTREPWRLGADPQATLIVPFDRFTTEGSYAFCGYPVSRTGVWTSTDGENELCEPTGHDFQGFLDLYLHARAIRYFGAALTQAQHESAVTKSFKMLASELFSDFAAERFQPFPKESTLEILARDLGVTREQLDLGHAEFPGALFQLLRKAHWDVR